MAMKIVILEDNIDRQVAMRACLADRFSTFEVVIFDSSAGTIQYLREHMGETIAVALDHDLELRPDGQGGFIDLGTGREVADYLATREPVCPVIIHTSNTVAEVGMRMVLQEGGWRTKRVVPFDDVQWIATDWFPAMRRAIVGPIRKVKAGVVA